MRGGGGILLLVVPFGIVGAIAVARSARRRFDTEDLLSAGIVSGLAAFLLGAQVAGRFEAIAGGAMWLIATGAAVVAIAASLVLARSLRPGDELVLRRAAWPVLAIVSAAAAAAIPIVVEIVLNRDALPASTPWYYWNQALETAAAGGLPATSIEWGLEVPFLADYPAFTTATAAVADFIGTPSLHAAHLMRIVAVLTTGIGIYALTRAWGGTRLASLAAAFGLLATEVYLLKLASYRPEAFGFGLMFLVPALFKRGLEARNIASAVLSGVGLLALAQVHGLAFTMSGIMLIATAISFLAAQASLENLKELGVFSAPIIGIWLIGGLALRGRVTDAAKLETLPAIGPDGVDPTWVFSSFGTRREGLEPPAISELVTDSLGRGFAGLPLGWFIAAAVVAFAVIAYFAVKRQAVALQFLGFALLVVTGVLVLSAIFFIGWETYVPRRTGARRVVQLAVAIVPLAGAVAASLPASGRRRAAAGATFAILAVAAWTFGISRLDRVSEVQRPPETTLALQSSVTLEPGLALSNAYTEGFLPVIFGVDGLLDGRAPYTEAGLLERANRLSRETRDFFADPATSDFDLNGYGVDYVIVSRRNWALGSSRVYDVDLAALRGHRELELLVREGGYAVFAVTGTPNE